MRDVRRRLPAHFAGQAVLPVVFISVTILASRLLLPVAAAPGRPALVALIYAVAGLVALILFCPRPVHMSAIIGWSAVAALLVSIILLADPATRPVSGALPALALTLFLLCGSIMTVRQGIPAPFLLTAVALLTFLPVLGAPLVEVTGNPARLTDFIVAASPLSAIAVALEFDYLRTPWFYAHSALGSLRYGYPGWLATCLLLALLPAGALLRDTLSNRRIVSKS